MLHKPAFRYHTWTFFYGIPRRLLGPFCGGRIPGKHPVTIAFWHWSRGERLAESPSWSMLSENGKKKKIWSEPSDFNWQTPFLETGEARECAAGPGNKC